MTASIKTASNEDLSQVLQSNARSHTMMIRYHDVRCRTGRYVLSLVLSPSLPGVPVPAESLEIRSL